MSSARVSLETWLRSIGADRTAHSGRSLMAHLMGTFDILYRWGCAESTCLAGGLHSIYGTNIFARETLGSDDRVMVRARFGAEAEALAWLFGSIDRPTAIELGYGVDRRCGCPVTLEDTELYALRLIEAANLLEQGGALARWPNIRAAAARP